MATKSSPSTWIIVSLCGVICVLVAIMSWPKPQPVVNRLPPPVNPFLNEQPIDTIAGEDAFTISEPDVVAAIRKQGIGLTPLNSPNTFAVADLPLKLTFQKTRNGQLAGMTFELEMVRAIPLVSRNGSPDDALVDDLVAKVLSPVEAVIHALADATLDSKTTQISALIKDCMGSSTGDFLKGETATVFVHRIDTGNGATVVISFSPLVVEK